MQRKSEAEEAVRVIPFAMADTIIEPFWGGLGVPGSQATAH